jgi:hypothetical protein
MSTSELTAMILSRASRPIAVHAYEDEDEDEDEWE